MLLSKKKKKKIIRIMENEDFSDSIFKAVVNNNLKLIQYSIGTHLEGIQK